MQRARRAESRQLTCPSQMAAQVIEADQCVRAAPKDQMLLITAPATQGLCSLHRNAADGPDPHLLTPSAWSVADG